jgi:hypothetical protein
MKKSCIQDRSLKYVRRVLYWQIYYVFYSYFNTSIKAGSPVDCPGKYRTYIID